MEQNVTMDDFYKEFGIDPNTDDPEKMDTAVGQASSTSGQGTETPSDTGTKAGPDNTTPSDKPQTTDAQDARTGTENQEDIKFSKSEQNKAFAQMRVENKRQSELLKSVAQTLGIDVRTATQEQINAAVQRNIIEKQAQQQGIPPAVLERLVALEQREAFAEQERVSQTAYDAFDTVQKMYGLTTEQLTKFAQELAEEGLNPFTNPSVNVLNEYRIRNFDAIVKKAGEDGARAEAERSAKATTHGTAPAKVNGTPPEQQEKINTVTDLTNFLENKN